MTTLEGIAKHEGVAIAVVAVVDSLSGINGVDTQILEEGIRAIKKGLNREEYSEVVVACDNMVMGISLKIPGINTIGIAAQAALDVPGLAPEVPCVIGLPNILEAVKPGDILIVDGTRGVVHIDPDPGTLIQYQHLEEERESRSKLFIASEHIPARTQSGETVFVYAHIMNEFEVEKALEEGADGLVVDQRGAECDDTDYYKALIRTAPGKPLLFVADFSCRVLIETAAKFAAPGQVTVVFPHTKSKKLIGEIAQLLSETEADPDASEVGVGVLFGGSESESDIQSAPHASFDLRRSALLKEPESVLRSNIGTWSRGRGIISPLLLIGKHMDKVEKLVQAGARSLAVLPDKVGEAKYKIRAMGVEDNE